MVFGLPSNYPHGKVSFWDFITGLKWAPGSRLYGIGYMIINTIYITILSIIFVVPLSILTALFIAKIAPKTGRTHANGYRNPRFNPVRYFWFIRRQLLSVGSTTLPTSSIVSYRVHRSILLQDSQHCQRILVLSMMIFPTITSISETANSCRA